MIEFINKHKIIFLRSVGILLFLTGVVSLFWSKPEKAMTENEIAEANIARVEAALPKSASSAVKKSQQSPFMKAYKEKQQEHIRYLVIALMVGGVLFFGYSFIKKRE